MKASQRKTALAAAGGLALLLLAFRSKPKGRVLIGPVTVDSEQVRFDAKTEAALQRLTLGLALARKQMGADPNTLASRQPSALETQQIEQVIALGRQLALASGGRVPLPADIEKMLALARRLPGSTLQTANAEFYRLLGIDPNGMNEATKPLTVASEKRARELISLWKPFSQDAVDTLFVHLDEARELAGAA